MTKVKICGIMNESDLGSALKFEADAVGFIVEIERSLHVLDVNEARDLIARVPPFTQSVAVIEPECVEDAVRIARETRCGALQIQAQLPIEEIKIIRSSIKARLIAAVPAGSVDPARLSALEGLVDAILADTPADGMLGGTGKVHDWNVSAALASNTNLPIILAGGLNPKNVGQAVSKVRPYAVDVSSGVETKGQKDPSKIESFIREVRSCK